MHDAVTIRPESRVSILDSVGLRRYDHTCSREQSVAYVVNIWPRLSETFILNEIIAVERLGVMVRIFSLENPKEEPVHSKVKEVRAKVTYLAHARRWNAGSHVRLLCRRPIGYCRGLLQAIRFRRWGGMKFFCQANYLANILLREPADHLHAHFASAPASVAMLTHELLGIPYTFTAHAKDIYVKTPPDVLRAEVERAEAVVTCTEYNRQYLLNRISSRGRSKLYCIYHGLDLSQFKFRSDSPSSGPPIILCVARLVEKKGIKHLISAADILRRRGRRFAIEIFGDGPLRVSLQNMIDHLHMQNEVKLLGAQPQERICCAYARATVFALPCMITENGDRDGIPNVLVEAMGTGVPVVSTTVSGIPELIESGRCGLLVEPNNPRMLADALERLLTDADLRERLAQAARARVEACFSVDRSSEQLLQLFSRKGHNENSVSLHGRRY